ncbi:hypothetical protein HGR_13639 [Hylemonella gracilis ATCC 19624]|uniref:Uncharacterized protein n=1 Tax=Hylemonella gracilis ATCC 19624 TaxID=887062 RepID=F3KW90_9BURK|nr:hypothetical protein HGR_13639 [Hylemonella gracilis ATCC 19624]
MSCDFVSRYVAEFANLISKTVFHRVQRTIESGTQMQVI